MATETKEKLIRVLQLMQTTDEKTPMNATQIVEKLSTEYELEGVDRRSIYRDIALLQDCGYDIVQTTDRRSGWYMNTHAFADWQIKIMMDAVQQARCVSINEAMQIRENLLNLTSKRGSGDENRCCFLIVYTRKNRYGISLISVFKTANIYICFFSLLPMFKFFLSHDI